MNTNDSRRGGHWGFAWASVCCGLLLTGCGWFSSTGQVTGQVLVNGQPQGGFEVTFTSTTQKGVFHGVAQEGGKFDLRQGRQMADIPTGDYKITITPIAISESQPAIDVELPPQYTEVDQASIIQTVAPGPNQITLEFTWDATKRKKRVVTSE